MENKYLFDIFTFGIIINHVIFYYLKFMSSTPTNLQKLYQDDPGALKSYHAELVDRNNARPEGERVPVIGLQELRALVQEAVVFDSTWRSDRPENASLAA